MINHYQWERQQQYSFDSAASCQNPKFCISISYISTISEITFQETRKLQLGTRFFYVGMFVLISLTPKFNRKFPFIMQMFGGRPKKTIITSLILCIFTSLCSSITSWTDIKGSIRNATSLPDISLNVISAVERCCSSKKTPSS